MSAESRGKLAQLACLAAELEAEDPRLFDVLMRYGQMLSRERTIERSSDIGPRPSLFLRTTQRRS